MALKVCPSIATANQTENVSNKSHHFEGPNIEGATRSFIQIDQAAVFQLLKELDATELKVFLFLTLRAYGWDEKTRRVGDGVVRASGTFVAKGTNLSAATSERCISKLKEKGLISKWTHSCKWGNTYLVKPILLRQSSDDNAPPPENKKKHPKDEAPQNEGTKKKEPKQTQIPQNEGPSSLKNRLLGPSNLGTNIDSRSVDLSLTETFKKYFSEIRAPLAEKKERACLTQIQKRNPDVTDEELLECFSMVSKTKDSKGNPVSMRFLWMANGFDSILTNARLKIQARKRREEEKQKEELKAKAEAPLEQQTSPEEVEQAKNFINRAFLSFPLRTMPSLPDMQSLAKQQAILLAQTTQLGMRPGAALVAQLI
jgi:hypothetical protein